MTNNKKVPVQPPKHISAVGSAGGASKMKPVIGEKKDTGKDKKE
jgi:hypothetical protein